MNTCRKCRGTGKDETAVRLEALGAVLPLNCSKCDGSGTEEERVMTIPDELVQAAAEAKCLLPVHPTFGVWSCDGHVAKHPECALQAAFAKLSECEEVREVLRAAGCAVPVSDWRPSPLVDAILAALARKFGTDA